MSQLLYSIHTFGMILTMQRTCGIPANRASGLGATSSDQGVVPERALRDQGQLAVRVGPTMVGAAPQTP